MANFRDTQCNSRNAIYIYPCAAMYPACANENSMHTRSLIPAILFLFATYSPITAQQTQQLLLPAAPEMSKRYYEPVVMPVYEVKYLARRNLDSAVEVLQHIIYTAGKNGDYNDLFEGFFVLGATYFHKNDYKNSETAYRYALAYGIRSNNPVVNICRTLNSTGNIFLIQGDYRQAARYFFGAARIAVRETEKDTVIADQLVRIYNNMSAALIRLEEYEKALYYLKQSEKLTNKLRHSIHLPSIWNNMAIVYSKTGYADKAWDYSRQALSLARSLQHYQAEYPALQELASLLLDKGQPAKAIPYLEAALKIQGTINASFTARTFYLLGHACLMQKNYTRAEYYFQSALEKTREAKAQDITLDIHRQLASLYAYAHDYSRAFKHLMTSYQLNDSLLNKEKATAVYQLEVKFRTAQKDKELTENQLQLNRQQRRLQQKNIWITGITGGALVLAILLFLIQRHYRYKNRLQARQQEIDTLKAAIQGEEKERARIARELHDGIAGMITAVKMNFTAVRNEYPFLAQTEHFAGAMHLLEETAQEIRHTAHNLTPEILVQHELQDAIALFCRQVRKSSDLDISFLAYGSFEGLDEHFKLSLYRIIQELLSNIVKHAQARHAIVQLSRHGNTFGLTVEDDGVGIRSAAFKNGMGMQSLQSRVKSLNGRLTVDSSEDSGTTVYIEFSLPDPAARRAQPGIPNPEPK